MREALMHGVICVYWLIAMFEPGLANHIRATGGPSFFAVCRPSASALCGPELGQTNFAM